MDISYKTPKAELDRRLTQFKNIMDRDNPDWQMALITGKVNQFYFTGTMQDALLVITPGGAPTLWVRRSVERAREESLLENIEPMGSYRTAASAYDSLPETIHLERDLIPLSLADRLGKYFTCRNFASLDRQILKTRSVKSGYELNLIAQSGKRHAALLHDKAPALLEEGMDEMTFGARLFSEMVGLDYQGLARFAMFQTEIVMGQLGFGENGCYPNYFNGPGGNRGNSPAVPLLGDPTRKLTPGDMVFADVAFGYRGYHTDHTMTYLFKGKLPQRAKEYHDFCVELEKEIAQRLKPGEIPSRIYADAMDRLDRKAPAGLAECFMGRPGNQVKFLGHGVGLHIDEYPVIAKGFDEPLEENMVLAIEPKCALDGIGTVGVEDTLVVTPQGGKSLTGNSPGLIPVG